MTFVTENSNISLKKTRFWKEKLVENMVTFDILPLNSSKRHWDVLLALLERSQ
jgi:hypothetical protein